MSLGRKFAPDDYFNNEGRRFVSKRRACVLLGRSDTAVSYYLKIGKYPGAFKRSIDGAAETWYIPANELGPIKAEPAACTPEVKPMPAPAPFTKPAPTKAAEANLLECCLCPEEAVHKGKRCVHLRRRGFMKGGAEVWTRYNRTLLMKECRPMASWARELPLTGDVLKKLPDAVMDPEPGSYCPSLPKAWPGLGRVDHIIKDTTQALADQYRKNAEVLKDMGLKQDICNASISSSADGKSLEIEIPVIKNEPLRRMTDLFKMLDDAQEKAVETAEKAEEAATQLQKLETLADKYNSLKADFAEMGWQL